MRPKLLPQLVAMRDELAQYFEFELLANYWKNPDYPKREGIYVTLEKDFTPFYVGITTNFRRRLREHRQSNFFVHHWYKPHYLYFFVATGEKATDQILRSAEKYLIEELHPWVNQRQRLLRNFALNRFLRRGQ